VNGKDALNRCRRGVQEVAGERGAMCVVCGKERRKECCVKVNQSRMSFGTARLKTADKRNPGADQLVDALRGDCERACRVVLLGEA
jgi:hypothetical protein